MGTVRDISRHTLIYTIGTFAQRAAGFLLLPLYTRFLAPADYGVLELISLTTDVICMICGLGVGATVYRFYAKYDAVRDKNAVVSTAYGVMAALFGVTVALCVLFSGQVSALVMSDRAYTGYFVVAFLSLLFNVGIEVPCLHLKATQRSVMFVSASMLKLLMQIAFNIYFIVFLKRGALGILESTLISNVVMSCLLSVMMFRDVGFSFSKEKAREMIVFGMPLILWSLGSFILTFSDRYFLKAFSDLATVGVYSLAYKFSFILTYFAVAPFQQIWEPRRFEIWKQAGGREIYLKVFRYSNLLMVSCALLIAIFSKEVVVLMADTAYHRAYTLVPVLLLSSIFQAWTSFCSFGILMEKKTREFALCAVFSTFFAILANFLLIPRWGAMGAAWATAIVFAIRFVAVYLLSQRAIFITYDWREVAVLSGLALAVWYAKSLFDAQPAVVSIAAGTVLLGSFLASVYRTSLSGDERRALAHFLRGLPS
ncbi:lipopolysaccharide biosynthesis protein [Geomonas edaphica]|uniref:lipopolysaccharide biosynthesis protein n=1 Tax=Geomonas edaphica TaxID=2570226 RepID=UPI0010A7E2DA|nr:oligosaccharide flippase family protein [Geomonas edaphica]